MYIKRYVFYTGNALNMALDKNYTDCTTIQVNVFSFISEKYILKYRVLFVISKFDNNYYYLRLLL